MESVKLPLHKWESNVEVLESENMPNPSTILGKVYDPLGIVSSTMVDGKGIYHEARDETKIGAPKYR